MKQVIYYPVRRILVLLDDDGYIKISYAGDIAERKFIRSLEKEDIQLHIAGGDFKMKIKPVNMTEFLTENMTKVVQTITVKKTSNE